MRQPRPGDIFAISMFGRDPNECHQKSICVGCGGPALEFKDELSAREYDVSVFCQKCQDSTFC